MKSFRFVQFVLIAFLMFLLSGCAGTLNKNFQAEDAMSLKGMTVAEVLKDMGEPCQKSIDSRGNGTMEYKRETESGDNNYINAFAKFSSVGVFSGCRTAVADILTLFFEKKKVVDYTFSEGGLNFSLVPTLGGSFPNSGSSEKPDRDHTPKKTATPKKSKKNLDSTDKDVKEGHIPDAVVEDSEDSQPQKAGIPITTSEVVPGSTTAVHKKLLAFAKEKDLGVEKKKDGCLVFKYHKGDITANFKPAGKKTVQVDISTTTASASILEEMYEALN